MRIEAADGHVVERAGTLTPYALEGVCDDARRAGSGTTVRISVVDTTTDEQVGQLRERLAGLERRGVTVHVGRRPDAARGGVRGN